MKRIVTLVIRCMTPQTFIFIWALIISFLEMDGIFKSSVHRKLELSEDSDNEGNRFIIVWRTELPLPFKNLDFS